MSEDSIQRPMRRLGLRSPKRAPSLLAGRFMRTEIPLFDLTADHLKLVRRWGLYGNDRYGTCGPTALANYYRLVSMYLTGREVDITDEAVYDLYKRSGNPDFDKNDPGGPGDGGVDMQTMLEAYTHGGLGGFYPVAFAAISPANPTAIRAAVSIFGGVLLGSKLTAAQDDQFNAGDPWDYVPKSAPWGGHATLVGRYQKPDALRDFSVVTWETVQDVTDDFIEQQNLEAWIVILPEHLGTRAFQEGVDVDGLREDFKALTGRDIPFQPGPALHDDLAADLELVQATTEFCAVRHAAAGEKVRRALQKWKSKRGLGL